MLLESAVWERHVRSAVTQVKRRSAVRMRKMYGSMMLAAISQVLTQKGHINRALLIRQVKSDRSDGVSIASWFSNQSRQGMLCCSAILDQKRLINGLWHKPSNSRETHFTGGEETDFIEQNKGLRSFDHVTV
ncbi:hypothetical protein PoB_003257800 [Plakobranchus ocellatus]|uniref:Uncharacterized protein n=1 Tax=Plakobranchus ocellatus TaxID=259542 RepID=A0AAV4AHR4_9GAST|nr:hypothetical protein PoB_003257800 [Plakobranchus ocellatus]